MEKKILKVILIGIVILGFNFINYETGSAETFIDRDSNSRPLPPMEYIINFHRKLDQEINLQLEETKRRLVEQYLKELRHERQQAINDLIDKVEEKEISEDSNSDNTNVQQGLETLRDKINATYEREDFLYEIKNSSPKDLIKMRDELASKASDKYALLKGYMEADNKDKYFAKKISELENQIQELKDKMWNEIDKLEGETVDKAEIDKIKKKYRNKIKKVRELKSFCWEIKELSTGELNNKKEELLNSITQNPGNETLGKKFEMLVNFIESYGKEIKNVVSKHKVIPMAPWTGENQAMGIVTSAYMDKNSEELIEEFAPEGINGIKRTPPNENSSHPTGFHSPIFNKSPSFSGGNGSFGVFFHTN